MSDTLTSLTLASRRAEAKPEAKGLEFETARIRKSSLECGQKPATVGLVLAVRDFHIIDADNLAGRRIDELLHLPDSGDRQ